MPSIFVFDSEYPTFFEFNLRLSPSMFKSCFGWIKVEMHLKQRPKCRWVSSEPDDSESWLFLGRFRVRKLCWQQSARWVLLERVDRQLCLYSSVPPPPTTWLPVSAHLSLSVGKYFPLYLLLLIIFSQQSPIQLGLIDNLSVYLLGGNVWHLGKRIRQ